MKKVEELGELLVGQSLTPPDPYHSLLNTLVRVVVEFCGCQRCCFIIRNLRDELVIKAGFPAGCHGVNQRITPEYGELFLKKVIREKNIILVEDPENDERVKYMQKLIECYSISSILFMPVFYKKDNLGVMILDGTDGKKLIIDEGVHKLSVLVGDLLGQEYSARRCY